MLLPSSLRIEIDEVRDVIRTVRKLNQAPYGQSSKVRTYINAVLAGTEKPKAELLAALHIKELPDGSYELLIE